MHLYPYIKSIIDADRCAVVICNLSHEIIYMNPAAVRSYAKWGGSQLVGKSLLACHNETSRQMIQKVTDWFLQSENHNRMYTHHNEKQNKDVYMIALRGEDGELIGYYEKHEYRTAETDAKYDFSGE